MPKRDDRLLLDIALRFGAELELEGLLDAVLEGFTSLCRAERALFALVDDVEGEIALSQVRTHELDWPATDGARLNASELAQVPVSRTVIDQALREGAVVIVPDTAEDTDYANKRSVRALHLRYLIGVPLRMRTGSRGVLYADSTVQAGMGWEPSVDLLEALGKLVSTAVENAELFEAERFRGRLLAEMVHGLRAPLAILSVNGQALKRLGESEDVRQSALDVCMTTDSMARTVDSALEMFRSEAKLDPPDVARVELGALVSAAMDGYRRWAGAHGIELLLDVDDGTPAIESSGERILLMVDNLLSNAIKYADRGSVIRVSVREQAQLEGWAELERDRFSPYGRAPGLRPEKGTRFVEITVQSTGRPIEPDLEKVLFQPWSRAEALARSSGLGLAITAQCALGLGGRICLRRPSPVQTEFALALPVALTDPRGQFFAAGADRP